MLSKVLGSQSLWTVSCRTFVSQQILGQIGGRDAHRLPDLTVTQLLDLVAWIESFREKIEDAFPDIMVGKVTSRVSSLLLYESHSLRSEMSTESLDEMGARKYTHPGSSHKRLVLSAAHITSDMIAEVWTGTIDCGLIATTDEPLMSAFARHGKLRKGVEKQKETGDSQTSAADEAKSLKVELDED